MVPDPLQLSRDRRLEHVTAKRNQAARAVDSLRASDRQQTETVDHLTLFLAAARSVVLLLEHLFGKDKPAYDRADPSEKARRRDFHLWWRASPEFGALAAHHLTDARNADTHRLFLPHFEVRAPDGELLLKTGTSLTGAVGLMRIGIHHRGGLPTRALFAFAGHGNVVDECVAYLALSDAAITAATATIHQLWPS